MTDTTHVAAITNELLARPTDLRSEPYTVPSYIWKRAREEMAVMLRERGWPVQSVEIGRDNFILMGVPICPETD